jgi:hypothetical protein
MLCYTPALTLMTLTATMTVVTTSHQSLTTAGRYTINKVDEQPILPVWYHDD